MAYVLWVFMSVWLMLIFGYAIYGAFVSPNFRDRFKDTKEDEYRVEFCSNKKKGEGKMKLQDKIEKLIKNGWSYGKLAKELGVSKTTISRWHKGENKPSYPYYEEELDYLLELLVRKDCQIDNLKIIETRISVDEQIKWHEQQLAELKAQKEKMKYQFTEDEKVILRNLPEEYNWLIRSQGGDLFVFTSEPQKIDYYWETVNKSKDSYCEIISTFNHLFKCIQWSDTEPCEFRKYI